MKWSFKIGRLAGIPVYVHATFFLIFAWVALQAHPKGGMAGVLSGSLFVAALFACVVLHELGHALAARRYGIVTRDITLLPIGGLARLERMPRDPKQELVVALAGPAVNVVIAAGIFVLLRLAGQMPPLEELERPFDPGSFLARLMVVNVFLVVFNMLPAFPMDGGRVLRALLAATTSYPRATRIAATVGQVMAALLFLYGLIAPNPVLMLISVFVWIGASQEAGAVERSAALAGVKVRTAMQTSFATLSPGDSLGRAVEYILAGAQQDFPVVVGDRVLGLLTRNDLLVGLAERRQHGLVSESLRTDVPSASPDEPLEDALLRFQGQPVASLPVLEHGRLVGLLTLENVSELLMIRSALERAGSSP